MMPTASLTSCAISNRVLELQDDEEETDGTVTKEAPSADNAELHQLLKSSNQKSEYLDAEVRGNTVDRLNSAGLLDEESVRGYAVNTDAQHLIKVGIDNKMLIEERRGSWCWWRP